MTSSSQAFEPEPTALPCTFGDYELLAEIGRGGMGIIYKARQCCLDRLCAVKMLRPELSCCSPDAETSLRAEAAAAASLDHPNIVGIFEFGREAGRLYFSMEYVEGQNLAQYTRSRILDPATVARLVRTIARAIAYAHSRGVMHHDLKPANVLIDAQGQPQITDFGLARRVDESHRGDPARGAGSPNYLAPEQASARFGEPNLLTDVHGLGTILYFLLTDRPPFVGVTAEDTIEAVLHIDVVPPRVLRPGLPVDLETICLRCLEKLPVRRYPSAAEVADELDRFLDDRPILARPAGWIERGRKWCRRHPAIAVLGSVIGLLLVTLASVASVAAMRIEAARRRAAASELETRRHLYNSDLLLASAAFAQGNHAQVRELLRRHEPASGTLDLRGWEWRHLRHATLGDTEAVLGWQSNSIAQMEALPDGQHLAAADASGTLRVWDLSRRQPAASRSLNAVGAPLFALARHHPWLLTTRREGTATNSIVLVLETPSLQTLREFPVPIRASAGAFATNDQAIWLVGAEAVAAFDLDSRTELRRYPIQRANRWREFAFSNQRDRFAIATQEGEVRLLDLATGAILSSFAGHVFQPVWGPAVYSLAFSPDDRWLVSAGSDGTARVWEVRQGRLARTLAGHADLVMAAAVSGNNRWIASVGRDSFVLLSAIDHEAPARQLRGADSVQTAVTFLADGRTPVSGGLDGCLRIWRPEPRVLHRWLTNLPPRTGAVTPLGPGDHFAAFTVPFGFTIQPISDDLATVSDPPSPERAAINVRQVGPNRFLSATLTRQGLLQIREWPDNRSRQRQLELPQPFTRGSLVLLDLSSDGRWVATADLTRGIHLYAAGDLALRQVFPGHARYLEFSPSGRWLVASEMAGPVNLWSPDTGQAGPRFIEHSQLSAAAFCQDETQLATVSFDGTANVWDLEAQRKTFALTSTAGPLSTVAWEPAGTRLFAGALNGTLVVWDLETGHETFLQKAHQQPITGLKVLPDGTLISFAPDGVRTWPAP